MQQRNRLHSSYPHPLRLLTYQPQHPCADSPRTIDAPYWVTRINSCFTCKLVFPSALSCNSIQIVFLQNSSVCQD